MLICVLVHLIMFSVHKKRDHIPLNKCQKWHCWAGSSFPWQHSPADWSKVGKHTGTLALWQQGPLSLCGFDWGGGGVEVWEKARNTKRDSLLAALLACEGGGPASHLLCSWGAAAAAWRLPGFPPSVRPTDRPPGASQLHSSPSPQGGARVVSAYDTAPPPLSNESKVNNYFTAKRFHSFLR